MGLREAYECEFDTKHLIDVVQTKPMPTWGYVEWLEERLQEAMESPANSPASPNQHSNGAEPSEISPQLCEGMPHGSCKGETMCDPNNTCFRPA